MTATFKVHARNAGRKIVIGSALGFIGLVVGLGCALLPIGAPLGVVGLAGLLLLWVMPDIQSVPKAWTSSMLLPFTLVLLSVPSFYGLILPGLPWISVRRAFLFAWIIPFCLVIAGSSESRSYIYQSLVTTRLICICVTAFVFIMIISTPIGISPFSSLSYNVNFFINCFVPMAAIILVVRTESQFAAIFRIAIMGVGIDLIIGAIEFHLKRPFLIYLVPKWMRDQILTSSPSAAYALLSGVGSRGGLYRASSTYTTALSWGEVSAMLLPLCLHFIAHGRSGLQRAYGIVGLLMCFTSVVLSGSRGAYAGMIAATITYTIVWSVRSWRRNPGKLTGTIWLTLYAMLSTAMLTSVVFVSRVRKLVLGGSEVQGSTDARADQWHLAVPKILARPFFGYGAGTSATVINYQLPGGILSVDGYHMTLLVDYGIPGLIFFFALFLAAVYVAFITYLKGTTSESVLGAALGAGLLAFVLYRFTLSQPDSLPLAFMMVGLVVAYHRMVLRSELQASGA